MSHNRFRVIAAIALAGTAGLSVASCADNPTQPAPEPAPLKIAGTFPETGYLQVDGARMRNGYTLAIEMLNEQGGIGGRRVHLVMRDDRSEPETAARLYQELAADTTVDLLLGPYSSAITAAALPVIEAARRPTIMPLAASTNLWEGQNRQWGVQMLTPARLYLRGSLELAAANGARSMALVYENTRFPISMAAGLREAAEEARVRIVLDESYAPSAADHAALATKAKNLQADIFIGGGYFDDAVAFTKALAAAQYSPMLTSLAIGPTIPQFVTDVGDLARCVTTNTPWHSSLNTRGPLASGETFVRRYTERFSEAPGHHAVAAFSAVEILAEALADMIGPDGAVDNAALRDYLFSATTNTVMGSYGVAPLGETGAGQQVRLQPLQIQWQDDGEGGFVQRVIHPASAANAEPCFNAAPNDPIQIAATFPETGVYSADGTKMQRGYALGVEMLNAQGGVGGRRVELTTYDDQSDPDMAAGIYRRLAGDSDVDLLLGPYSSVITKAVLPVIEAARRPTIMPMAASAELWEGEVRQWGVQMLRNARGNLTGSVELAVENGAETAALVWENSTFPISVAVGVREAARTAGLRLVMDKSYEAGAADHAALAQEAKGAGADLFIGGGYTDDAIALARALDAAEYSPMLTSLLIGPAEPRFAEELGALARCVAGNTPWISSIRTRGRLADSQTFVERYRARYGEEAGYHAAGGFGAVELLTEALEETMQGGRIDNAALRDRLFGDTTQTVLGAYGVIPLGEAGAGKQRRLPTLQLQWQDDGSGTLEQKIVYPADLKNAEPCFNAEPSNPIRIAATFPETGVYSADGTKMRRGYALGVQMLNEQGGIGGRRVELTTYDDQSDPAMAAGIYRRLTRDSDIDLFLGPYSSAITNTVLPVIEAAGRPTIMPMAASAELWEGEARQWGVQMLRNARGYLTGSVELAVENGAETAALVWENSTFPISVAVGVREAARAANLNLVMDKSYEAGAADHAALAQEAKDAGADLFIGGGYTDDAIAFARALDAAEYSPMLTSLLIGPAEPRFMEELGALARCVTGNTPWIPSIRTRGRLADSQTFVQRYRALYSEEAGYQAAGGFGAVELLTEALEETMQDGGIDNAALRDFIFSDSTQTVLGAYGVIPLGEAGAGRQRRLPTLQVQWQDDGSGTLEQKIVYPAELKNAEPCFNS